MPVSPSREFPKKSVSNDSLSTTASDTDLLRSGKKTPARIWIKEVDEEALYVADVEEVRVSPVVSRRGYLNFLEEKTSGWLRRYVVSALLYSDMGAYAGAARRRVHLATVLLRPPSGHRPGRRQANITPISFT